MARRGRAAGPPRRAQLAGLRNSSVSIGTPGATNTHAAETSRIKQIYDVPLTIVPFNGNSEVQAALLGNNVDAGFVNVSQDVLPNFESNAIRPLIDPSVPNPTLPPSIEEMLEAVSGRGGAPATPQAAPPSVDPQTAAQALDYLLGP